MAKLVGRRTDSGPLNCFALLPEMTTMEGRKEGRKAEQVGRRHGGGRGEAAAAAGEESAGGLVGRRIHLCRNITLICAQRWPKRKAQGFANHA